MSQHTSIRPAGVDWKWVLDYTEDYDIDRPTVTEYLVSIFGEYEFFVKVITSSHH